MIDDCGVINAYGKLKELSKVIGGKGKCGVIKRVKIFIASSIDELKDDRLNIKAFFADINDVYFDRGVMFKPVMCESYDNAIAAEGKQSQYDEEIRNSELCFFLFYKKVGDYTKHEFEVALESFGKTQKPKIVTYFKYLDETQKESEEIRKFLSMLQNELSHYYSRYDSIDGLKLGIIMQIMRMGLDESDIVIEDGRIVLGEKVIAECENIPAFSKNKELSVLKEKLKETTDNSNRLYDLCRENPDDDEMYEKYMIANKEKKDIQTKISNMEINMLRTFEKIAVSSDSELTEMQKEAYRRFEAGDNDGQLEVLDRDEILSGMNKSEIITEIGKSELKSRINELLQRIKALEIKGYSPDIIEETDKNYKIICEKTEQANLDKKPLQEYIHFLTSQEEYERAEEFLEKLEAYYKIEKADDIKYLELYNSWLVVLKNGTKKIEEIFVKMQKYIDNVEKEGINGKCYAAKCYVNFSPVFREKGDLKNAFKAAEKAVTIYKELGTEYAAALKEDIASAYNTMGNYYTENGDFEKAKENFITALGILEKSDKKEPGKQSYIKAMCYVNLATLYYKNCEVNTEFIKEAETYYENAIQITEELVLRNPGEYERFYALCLVNFSSFCKTTDYNDAKKYANKAIDICTRRNKGDDVTYMKYKASALETLARVAEKDKTADEYYLKAVEEFEKIYNKTGTVESAVNLAKIYCNIGDYYIETFVHELSIDYFIDGYNLLEKMEKSGSVAEIFAILCCKLGNWYSNMGDADKMMKYYNEAIGIYEKSANDDMSIMGLIMTYISFGTDCERIKEIEDAGKYYNKAKEYAENKEETGGEPFAQKVAECYAKIGLMHKKYGNKEAANINFEKAIEKYMKLAEKEPLKYFLTAAHLKMEMDNN